MVEVNSVFLHTRQLFIITGEPKSSSRYRTNSLLNVATFLFFRILLLGWMTRWLTVNRDRIPLAFFTAGSVGLAVIVLMNIALFCRIIFVDFSDVLRFGKKADKGKMEAEKHPVNFCNGSRNGSCSYYNGTGFYQNGNCSTEQNVLVQSNGNTSFIKSIFEEEDKL